MSTQNTPTPRKITVVSTRNNKVANIYPETLNQDGSQPHPVITWGDLIPLIQAEGFEIAKMSVVESINKTTLESLDAVLPTGDFKIFLRPKQTKSGSTPDFTAMKFGDLRNNYLKGNEPVQKFLSEKYNKNWTQLKTTEIQEGLTEFYKNQSTGEPVTAVEEVSNYVTEEVTEVVEKQPNSLDIINRVITLLNSLPVEKLDDSLAEEDLQERISYLTDEVEALKEIFVDAGLEPTEGITIGDLPAANVANVVDSVKEAAISKEELKARAEREAEEKAQREAEEKRKAEEKAEFAAALAEAKEIDRGFSN